MLSDHGNWVTAIRAGYQLPSVSEGMPLPEAISRTLASIDSHLSTSPTVRTYLAALPKGAGHLCPDSPLDELVSYVASQKGLIDKDDPRRNLDFLVEFIRPVFQFERDMVLQTVLASGASPLEQHLFLVLREVAEAHDALWAKWFAMVVVPYQSLSVADQQNYDTTHKPVLLQYDYSVFTIAPDNAIENRTTWMEAFPAEVGAIVRLLEELADYPEPELAQYFATLSQAYSCTNVAELDQRWTAVDEAWICIPPTSLLVPVHGMESGYEHPQCVSPEMRLDLRTNLERALIETARKGAIEHAEAMAIDPDLVAEARSRLTRIDVGIFTTAFRAGVGLNFRYSGQAVPNRQEVLAKGGRVFVEESSSQRAAKRYRDLCQRHLTADSAVWVVPLIDVTPQVRSTATHEFAHPLGRSAASDAAIGGDGMKIMEEAKATLLGISAAEFVNPSPEHRAELVANMVGRMIRFMVRSELESATFAPYVRENLAAATTLFDSKVLSIGPDGISVDAELARTNVWFAHLAILNRAIIWAYNAHERRALDKMAARYCDRNRPDIAQLIAWVNRAG